MKMFLISFLVILYIIMFLVLYIDIAPVIEGAVHHIGSRRFEFGGTDLTNFLAQELGKSNPQVNISMSDVEKIKEQYSCCVEDELAYQKTQYSCPVEKHTLPDGQVCFLDFYDNFDL
jgi:actin-related protein 7